MLTWLKDWAIGLLGTTAYRLVPFLFILIVGVLIIKICRLCRHVRYPLSIINYPLKQKSQHRESGADFFAFY